MKQVIVEEKRKSKKNEELRAYQKIIVPFLVSVINPSKRHKCHIEQAIHISDILWPYKTLKIKQQQKLMIP